MLWTVFVTSLTRIASPLRYVSRICAWHASCSLARRRFVVSTFFNPADAEKETQCLARAGTRFARAPTLR
jgi:hypothetical protein